MSTFKSDTPCDPASQFLRKTSRPQRQVMVLNTTNSPVPIEKKDLLYTKFHSEKKDLDRKRSVTCELKYGNAVPVAAMFYLQGLQK